MINIKTLPNGVRIVSELMPQSRSAAVVFWVGHGSRHEPKGFGGASHAIEHMLFKGTKTRTAAQLASEIDAIGGQVNAYTTKESTSYYVRALESHLPKALNLLGDLFFNPLFDKDAWELERGVIIEEIAMCEDQPDDLVFQNLYSAVYRNMPLGPPVIGSAEELSNMTAESLAAYKAENYRTSDMIISIAGKFTEEHLDSIEEMFTKLPKTEYSSVAPSIYTPDFYLREKDIEQNHLVLAFPGLPVNRNYAYSVMHSILGSGMSSRLFQKIREEHGLCYAIYSSHLSHRDTGSLIIYVALSSETESKALELIKSSVASYIETGPTDDELVRAREQFKANTVMGEESIVNRAYSLGHSTLFFGDVLDTDEIISRINAISTDDVLNIAREVFDFSKISLSVVGKPNSEAAYRGVLGL